MPGHAMPLPASGSESAEGAMGGLLTTWDSDTGAAPLSDRARESSPAVPVPRMRVQRLCALRPCT